MPSDHHLRDFVTHLSPGSIFIAYLILILLAVILRYCCKKCEYFKACRKLHERVKDIQVMQQLENFYAALPPKVRESLIREEVQDALRTNTSKLDKEMLKDLVLVGGL